MSPSDRLPAPHVPVLLDEVIAALAIAPGETHVDGTFGAGGYTRAMLEKGLPESSPSIAIRMRSSEGEALAASSGGRLTLVPERFSRMRQALADRDVDAVDGVDARYRRLLDAARPAPSAASPSRPTARSTCGWPRTARAPPISSTSAPRRRSPTSSIAMARSPSRAASPGRSSPPGRSSGPASSPRSSARRSAIMPA